MVISSVVNPIIGNTINPVIGGWTPSDLPNLAVWLDAADSSTITLNGATVVGWRNKGNLGVANAAQATALRQPLYVANAVNNKPALRFRHDGTNASQMDISDSAGLDYTQFTVYTVFQRVTDLGATETMAGKYTTTGNQREWKTDVSSVDVANLIISTNGTAATTRDQATTLTVGVRRWLRAGYDGTAMRLLVSGGAEATTNVASIFNGTAKYTIGARADFADPYAGHIAEHFFFTRWLSADERARMEAYLNNKWGI